MTHARLLAVQRAAWQEPQAPRGANGLVDALVEAGRALDGAALGKLENALTAWSAWSYRLVTVWFLVAVSAMLAAAATLVAFVLVRSGHLDGFPSWLVWGCGSAAAAAVVFAPLTGWSDRRVRSRLRLLRARQDPYRLLQLAVPVVAVAQLPARLFTERTCTLSPSGFPQGMPFVFPWPAHVADTAATLASRSVLSVGQVSMLLEVLADNSPAAGSVPVST